MKVILLQDVARVGKRFEIKEVPTGHGLNYLIPRGLAQPATKENIKKVETQAQKVAEVKDGEDASFAQLLKAMKNQTVEMEVEVNEKGHLFKGIKEEDVASEISEKQSTQVLSTQVLLKNSPIKEIGEYEVTLQSGDMSGVCTLNIKSK